MSTALMIQDQSNNNKTLLGVEDKSVPWMLNTFLVQTGKNSISVLTVNLCDHGQFCWFLEKVFFMLAIEAFIQLNISFYLLYTVKMPTPPTLNEGYV